MSKKPSGSYCRRCGVWRQVKTPNASAPLCRDCRSVLSKKELSAWYEEKKEAA